MLSERTEIVREQKAAAVPTSSRNADVRLPATVVVTPAGVTLRMTLLPVSATKRLPAESKAMPVGLLKRADVPVPST